MEFSRQEYQSGLPFPSPRKERETALNILFSEIWSFPGGSDSKESAYIAGDPNSIPGEGNGYPIQYSCLENSTEETGGPYSWGRKESDMTE